MSDNIDSAAIASRITNSAAAGTKRCYKDGNKKKSKHPVALPPFDLFRSAASPPPTADDKSEATAALPDVNDVFENVANLLKGKKNIVALVGAGLSTSVGMYVL